MVITTHKDSTMMHEDCLLKNTKVTVGYLEKKSCYTKYIHKSARNAAYVEKSCLHSSSLSSGGHHLGHCTSHRPYCQGERSQLYQKELLDCHASGTSLEID